MSSIKNWIIAARLRTLPLSFASILAGHALAIQYTDIRWDIFVLTLITTLFLQILSNFANDYGDAEHGADHDQRKGPERMVSSGRISKSAMKNGLFLTAILSFLSGLLLLFLSFSKAEIPIALGMLGLGILSIAAAIKYTSGKNPYGYRGLGDIFVLIFFGLVGVLGSLYLQSKQIGYLDLFAALAFGLQAVAVLNLNNMRDILSDKQAGKISIPVRIGFSNAKIYHAFLIISSLVLLFIYAIYNWYKVSEWAFILLYPILIIHLVKVLRTKDELQLDSQLKVVALSSFLISVLILVFQI